MDKPVLESRLFRRGGFGYLEDQDRYLTAREEPEFSFGFIGCGMMGQEHIRNTLLLGRARVGGIFDPASRSISHTLKGIDRQHAQRPAVYTSMEEACADPNTDALIIATPNHTHVEVMRLAARHDKAIFLEKPIATTVADAFEVCELATNHPHLVRLGLQYRYKAMYAEAIEEIFERRSIGQVHSVNMLEHRFPFLDKVNQWNKFDAYTGGALIEKCCHYFDLMNLFAAGTPVRVFAAGNQAVNFHEFTYDNKRADGIDQAQVTIEYDNGVIGGFSLCMFAPGSREELTVCGDVGRLHACEQVMPGAEYNSQVQVWRGENGASRTTNPTYPSYIEGAGHHGSTFFEHLAFTDDLAKGKNTGPTPADGFWSVMVGAAAQESIARRSAVEVTDILPDNFDATIFANPTTSG